MDIPDINLNLNLTFNDKDFTKEYVMIFFLIITINIYLLLHIFDFVFCKLIDVWTNYKNRNINRNIEI